MKTNLKRLLALAMVLAMIFALAPAAFADEMSGENEDFYSEDYAGNLYAGDNEHETGLLVPQVYVVIPIYDLPLSVGESTTVTATVTDADSGASYDWYCSDPDVVSIRGSRETVSVTARSAGTATVSLTVTRGDGLSSDADYFTVTVGSASTPVSVSGGDRLQIEAGSSTRLSASVSGGSGSYTYEWECLGDAALSFRDKMRGNAEVYAGKAGSGTVYLTVYDAEDPSNNDMVTWEFTVTGKQAEAPTVEMSRGSVDIGAGGSGSLSLYVTGGSGNYRYEWNSDNPNIVSVAANGSSADIYAASSLMPGANTAQISARVYDNETGLSSSTVYCTVTVSGGSASCDVSDTAAVGQHYSMDTLARRISDYYRGQFGTAINYSASVKFQNTGSSAGSIRLQDSSTVRADTSYSFATFQDMFFDGTNSGSFSTYYQIVDGGNTISGSITLSVSGGIAVIDASLSPTILSMTTGSSQYLTLSVTPWNASYTVDWVVSNNYLLSVTGGGNKVTVRTNNNTGSGTVTAIVTDAFGNKISRSCSVSVTQYAPYDPNQYYNPSLTLMLGSDYYGSKIADNLSDRFRSSFGVYPGEGATIIFPTLGSSVYGTMCTRNGASVEAKRTYSFREFVDMYFIPTAVGTYSYQYQLNYKTNTLQGTVNVQIESASITVDLSPNSLILAPYSSQYITLNVSPASANYRVSWTSSDNRVATVSGSNTSATVTSAGSGTATVTAIVTDSRGVELRRTCTVVVTSGGSAFSPTVSTTLGVPYVGTGASGAMRSQFQSVYGTALADSAIIRFSSTGNTEVGVTRLADGSMIRPNTDYTLAQFVAMYTQPVAAGTYSVPYTLSYAGKSLSGTVNVTINSASISTDLNLSARAPYGFSDPLPSGITGGALFTDSIRNAVGSGWSYIRFTKTSDGTGTLYLDRNYTALSQTANVTQAMLAQLYFVPGSLTGVFSAPYTVYTSTGGVLGTGTLNVNTQPIVFSDVPADAYYAPAVTWAVSRGITSGTGGTFFSPDMIVTRGQAVTFLWRAAGQPKSVLTVNPFTDVVPGSYYYDAVLWAVQQGITNGTTQTTFSPDLPLHRDQMLTFLCRANGAYAGGDNWSQLATDWATNRGLLAGIPGVFVAAGDCPRSEVVFYLWKNYNG